MKHQCHKCGALLQSDDTWVPDDMTDTRRYCYNHAPEDAIRLKDIMRPRIHHETKAQS